MYAELLSPPKGSRTRPALAVFAAMLALLALGCDAAEQNKSLRLTTEGVQAYRDGNYGGASKKFKDALSIWPQNAQANYLLGQIYLWKYEQPEQAVTYLEAATNLDGTKSDYWYQRGTCELQLKRYDSAKISLDKTLELQPKHADAHYRKGLIAETQAKPKDAARSYGESVQLDPRKPHAYYNLGDLYFRNHKLKEAEQVFKNGTENNPNHPELHHGLGLTYLTLKRNEEALVEFQEAVRLRPTYSSALYNLGMTFVALKKHKNAKLYLDRFLKSARSGDGANEARITAAEARLYEIEKELGE